MSHTITKTKSMPRDRALIPKVPRRVGWTLGLVLPLTATAFILLQRLSALPNDSWTWTIHWELLAFTFLLSPLNWALETLKWDELLPYGSPSRRMREVLYGVSWSMIGPMRMGAIVGRVSATREKERNQACRAFATASAAQWWCTITGAGIALMACNMPRAALPVMTLSAISLGLYFNWSPKFWRILRKCQIMGDWRIARRINKTRRIRALKLSVLRYMVMLTQFVVVLHAFHHNGSVPWFDRCLDQMTGASLTWGLTSLAPLSLLGDLGVREAAALLSLPALTAEDTTAIIGAMLALWVANLLLPALYGMHLQRRYLQRNQGRTTLRS